MSRFAPWLAMAVLVAAGPSGASDDLTGEPRKLGYSIGYQVGGDFRRQGIGLDPENVVQGVVDALAGSEAALGAEEMRDVLARLREQAAAAAQREHRRRASENRERGAAFLAENRGRPGVTTLPSGLQYEVLAGGDGAPPAARDTVTVHYRGTLVDGTPFDSSYERGEPATFRVDAAIPGWVEGLQRMRPGATYRLFVPPELAYGPRGAGDRVGPESTLVYEVELLSVQRAE